MIKGEVVVTDYGFASLEPELKILKEAGYKVSPYQCRTEEEVLQIVEEADALLVQWAPISAAVINRLKKCKIIVRYGIGVDNVDMAMANEKNIPVCNVPDYCINEVADHTLAMALALGRQLGETTIQMNKGLWKITPPKAMATFREMVFATAGFGRIAREVLIRAKAFKFTLAAYDPYVSKETMEAMGVRKLEIEELFQQADILSLHLPLNPATRHFINSEYLNYMKSSAILINTSRGGLVDSKSLALALQKDKLGGAGLDVFETEPLPADDPLWQCPSTILTSHTAWYSERSVPVLQSMAAQEVLRGLMGEKLQNRVN